MNSFLARTTIMGALLLGIASLPLIAQSAATDQKITTFIEQSSGKLLTLYKELHTNPELSFQEKNTAAKIAAQLKPLGYQVTENFGGHGIVAVLKNGKGPCVLVRTDLDALPIEEQTGLPYASKVQMTNDDGKTVSVMHACGHDVHMTVFTGVAQALTQFKSQWQGTVVLVGQPAEERSGGAIAMLKEGLYEKFPRPDYGLALHVNSSMPAGKVGYTEGSIMASVDAVTIKIQGVGGHGALPHTTKDPVVVAAQTVLALQTIVSREVSPFQPAVVTVGSIQGGTQFNVIPDEVTMQLTVRAYDEQVRQQIITSIKRITQHMAESAGVPTDRMPVVTVREPYTPSTYNDVALTRRLTASFVRVLGKENVLDTPPSTVGEDFSRYSLVEPKIPTCMFWLGAVDPQKIADSEKNGTPLPSLHSSKFAPLPEPAIKTGVKAMTAAVMDLLTTKTNP